MAIDEAQLDDVGSGLAPVTPGWFVVNAADAAWVRNGRSLGVTAHRRTGRCRHVRGHDRQRSILVEL